MRIKKHSNVKGVIEMIRGEYNARIRILAFKRDGVYIYDENEIKTEFPSAGYVFAPNLFSEDDYKVGDLLEFSTLPFDSPNGPDEMRLDVKVPIKTAGTELFRIDEDILDNPLALDQVRLKMFITEATGNFYIQNYSKVYGPFKLSGNEVIPITDTKVHRFDKIPPIIAIADKLYLLEKPTEIVARIDCSRPAELVSWFKKNLKSLTLPSQEIQQLLQQLDQAEIADLDSAKFARIKKLTESLLLTRQELELLSRTSTTLAEIFTNSLQHLRDELKAEEIEPYEKERVQIQVECSRLTQANKQLQLELETILAQKEELSNEVDFLESNRIRLIKDIKIRSALAETTPEIIPNTASEKKLFTFEIQSYQKRKQAFNDLSTFISTYKSLFEDGDLGPGEGKKALFQLRDKRALLCANPMFIRLIAMNSNNCNLFIQQVEADWIKFESFYDNGLKQCWQSAHNNPDIIHFLLLEDINMAAIECYARPMMDLIAGIRNTLPGLQTCWPQNLWIFGVPIEKNGETEFGIPLLAHSFRDWGAIPIFANINCELGKDDRYLPLQALIGHDFEFSVSINVFFA
ncbi:hypothetical protein [Chitinophaga sp. GbtcB8]|uniref:hypothetical protein n=1 Tax=Chitinophaga sp. GbtcB8 TaxID=2824753 RepID=UPI001C2F72F5|nr:hypothetical protein [Chitinophaga sp. GbtcB8]